MLSQEEIYRLVFAEQWQSILTLLHQNKADIASDFLLSHAALVFETEFFKKVSGYPDNSADIIAILEDLYILHQGNFYHLNVANYKQLLIELVRRSQPKSAYNYAMLIPNEEGSRPVIQKYQLELADKEKRQQQQMAGRLPDNWIEIYNRLYELINVQGTANYFSGPMFINVIKEVLPYYPDYRQYIEDRTKRGKSITRKIYYYDILMDLPSDVRGRVLNIILDRTRPFAQDKVEAIEVLLGKRTANSDSAQITPAPHSKLGAPVVFISYSWDNEEHKKWVLNLARQLSSNGVEVILDAYYLRPGSNLPHFVEDSIRRATRIIIVFTPNYKLKAEKRAGGVGYEYSIMNADLYRNQTGNDKIIPILRIGSEEESIPSFMRQYIHIDITNDENFENSYNDLIREIHDQPAIQKPAVGEKPSFN